MDRRSGLLGVGGVTAGGLAVLASSCCAIPLALTMLGVSSGALGLLDILQPLRWLFLAASVALVAAGGFYAYRKRSRLGLVVVGFAVLLLSVAASAPLWEAPLTRTLLALH